VYRRLKRVPSSVELHWDVAFPDSVVRFNPSQWWLRARRVTLRAGTALIPPVEDEFLHLCHHAFSAGAITLRHLSDIARLYLASGCTAEQLLNRARTSGTLGFMCQALSLCRDLWSLPGVPDLAPQFIPRFRRSLLRNILAERTVLSQGGRLWWPLRLICYGALLPPHATKLRDLAASTSLRQLTPLETEPRTAFLRIKMGFSLLYAFGLCTLPQWAFHILPPQVSRRHDPVVLSLTD
jgi:hypothetical protein